MFLKNVETEVWYVYHAKYDRLLHR